MSIPSQAECDLSKPEEHFLWALRGLGWGDHPVAIPRPILEKWSKHLVECGAVHVLALYALADEDGKIDISDLPKQKIKYVNYARGEDHELNIAGKWLPVEAEEPEPVKVPPASSLSPAEKAILAAELKQEGYL